MNPPNNENAENRIKAEQLYQQGREQEINKNYFAALKLYQESLNLYESEQTQAAYDKMLATVGPR